MGGSTIKFWPPPFFVWMFPRVSVIPKGKSSLKSVFLLPRCLRPSRRPIVYMFAAVRWRREVAVSPTWPRQAVLDPDARSQKPGSLCSLNAGRVRPPGRWGRVCAGCRFPAGQGTASPGASTPSPRPTRPGRALAAPARMVWPGSKGRRGALPALGELAKAAPPAESALY